MNNLSFLNSAVKGETAFKTVYNAADSGALPCLMTGASLIHKTLICSALNTLGGFPLLIICESESSAFTLYDDLRILGVDAAFFPYRDYEFSGAVSNSKEFEHKRIDTLSALADGAKCVTVTSIDAAISRTIPKETLKALSFNISVGESYNIENLCNRLLDAGYTRADTVDGAGQFALRGGILDVFTADSKNPCRIEFWGDEVDTISLFDTETQRRTDNIDALRIVPAKECVCKSEDLIEILKKYLSNNKKLSEIRIKNIFDDISLLESGMTIPLDRYMPLIYTSFASIFDYCDNAVPVVFESGNLFERLASIEQMHIEDLSSLLTSGRVSKGCDKFMLNKSEFISLIEKSIILDNFVRGSYEISLKTLCDIKAKRNNFWNGDIEVLAEDLDYAVRSNYAVVILAGEEKGAKLLSEDLTAKGIPAVFEANPTIQKGKTVVTTGYLSSGFEFVENGVLVVTCRRISGGENKKKRLPKNAAAIGSLDEIKAGDLVVHSSHGIGVFGGIQSITNSGITKDYIKIRYAGQDSLYVPVTQLDLVSRYIGADSGNVKLHKLGTSEWQRTRSRVKRAVKDMAKQLTELYAKRMAAKGYAFGEDTDLQNNFERRFPFEETKDQLRCIDEIKGDMMKPNPMDRLLCGDVGFGKTEVALRAAFKCVCEGKQCAILVPTTILAWQHFNTALSRIGDIPVEIRLLSRFVTPKQAEKTIADLKKGRVDIVIGTHRLISKDVTFKDLGLVIIDEEQRFGVAQKERLKELYPSVDVLTLSATPIPRTLNMAMSGLRDMSVIEEAPADRQPVQTYVLEQSNGILYDAINKELRRGGQVYYLHNRVETIYKVASRLKAVLPDARIEVAHGKMGEEALSDVWKRLIENEIDVLVCTTIIETGVDVPNVNTLIIEDADRMGLSQLHQLRGRVGRSPRRAYAYFCFRGGKALNEDAHKRLEAIRQFTEFGSGFHIAMRDLEIRGAGSVLGGAQHGNMEAVGYDMYIKLLNDAMKGIEIEEEKEEEVCTIDLNISAHIPENYIPSLSSRLGIYKRIADITNDDDAADVIDELIDRFGEPPRSVMGLIDIALLRNKAQAVGIYEITREQNEVKLHTKEQSAELFLKLGAVFGERLKMHTKENGALSIKLNAGTKLIDIVGEIVNAL